MMLMTMRVHGADVQPFRVPHSVIVDACRPAIYVADRCVAELLLSPMYRDEHSIQQRDD